MQCDLFAPCRTMGDLQSCLKAPVHAVPTVQYVVRNFDLPISNEDYEWLTQNEISFFATRALESVATRKTARSSNLSDQTLTVDSPFVLLGVCLYAYTEPNATLVEGNQFGPQAGLDALNRLPASPLNLRNNNALFADLLNVHTPPALPDNFFACPAQLDWGGAGLKAIHHFLHAFRLVMKCPSSNYELLMDESLADIGNCCAQADYYGFGNTKTPHILMTQRINQRLVELSTEGLPPNANATVAQGPGYFVPINAEQQVDAEITPYRLAADFQAFGKVQTSPTIEQWYRMPCPIPFTPSTKIKITLQKREGDELYLDKMIDEMSFFRCLAPVDSLPCTFGLSEDGGTPNDNNGLACFTKIPGGRVRYGIGLKGFEVRPGVCEQLMAMIEGKSFAEVAAAYPDLVGPGGVQNAMSYQNQICVPVGAVGDPHEGR